MISRGPPLQQVQITGNEHDIASTIALPNPSQTDGMIKISAASYH